MFKLFKKKVKDERNPWLDISHDCNWLEANNGKELVCGDCGRRRANNAKKKED